MTGKYISLPGYSCQSLQRETYLLSHLLPEWGTAVGKVLPQTSQSQLTFEAQLADLLSSSPLQQSPADAISSQSQSQQRSTLDWNELIDRSVTEFTAGAYERYQRWVTGRYLRVKCRGGFVVDLDCSDSAFDRIGSGLRSQCLVKVRHHWADQTMDAPEDAQVLGVYNSHVVSDAKWFVFSRVTVSCFAVLYYCFPRSGTALNVQVAQKAVTPHQH